MPTDAEKYYNLTLLASQLNEMEPGVAPTDSRHRPDQRLMENGKWEESNVEKLRLEDKQRSKQKKCELTNTELGPIIEPYVPCWFQKTLDPITGSILYIYQHEYWQCKETQNWSRCPDIF